MNVSSINFETRD